MTSALATAPATRPFFAPVPDSLPPFDDQRPSPIPAQITRLDQKWSATELVELRAATPVTRQEASVSGEQDRGADAVRHVATVLSRALVEVLGRRRPVTHLQRYCSPHLYAGLTRYTTAGPFRARSMRLSQPATGVAEVSLVVQAGERVRAIAFRMEHQDRWTLTALEIG